MAKYAKKKQGIAGLIFIWILVILLALGTFGVIRSYNLDNSKIINNDQLADIVAAAFQKHAGEITEDDLASVEGFAFADYGTAAEIMIYMPGYNAAYDAYTAEGVTEEQKKELTDPSSLIFYTSMTETNVYDDLHLFKGITTLNVMNNAAGLKEVDIISIAAENAPGLTSLGLRSFAVNDLSPITKLSKLETLSIYDSNLSDISALSSLENISYLDLSETEVTDISALKSLDNDKVEIIYLTGNNITDWSPLAHIDEDKIIKEEPTEEETTEEATEEENSEESTEAESENTETSEN